MGSFIKHDLSDADSVHFYLAGELPSTNLSLSFANFPSKPILLSLNSSSKSNSIQIKASNADIRDHISELAIFNTTVVFDETGDLHIPNMNLKNSEIHPVDTIIRSDTFESDIESLKSIRQIVSEHIELHMFEPSHQIIHRTQLKCSESGIIIFNEISGEKSVYVDGIEFHVVFPDSNSIFTFSSTYDHPTFNIDLLNSNVTLNFLSLSKSIAQSNPVFMIESYQNTTLNFPQCTWPEYQVPIIRLLRRGPVCINFYATRVPLFISSAPTEYLLLIVPHAKETGLTGDLGIYKNYTTIIAPDNETRIFTIGQISIDDQVHLYSRGSNLRVIIEHFIIVRQGLVSVIGGPAVYQFKKITNNYMLFEVENVLFSGILQNNLRFTMQLSGAMNITGKYTFEPDARIITIPQIHTYPSDKVLVNFYGTIYILFIVQAEESFSQHTIVFPPKSPENRKGFIQGVNYFPQINGKSKNSSFIGMYLFKFPNSTYDSFYLTTPETTGAPEGFVRLDTPEAYSSFYKYFDFNIAELTFMVESPLYDQSGEPVPINLSRFEFPQKLVEFKFVSDKTKGVPLYLTTSSFHRNVFHRFRFENVEVHFVNDTQWDGVITNYEIHLKNATFATKPNFMPVNNVYTDFLSTQQALPTQSIIFTDCPASQLRIGSRNATFYRNNKIVKRLPFQGYYPIVCFDRISSNTLTIEPFPGETPATNIRIHDLSELTLIIEDGWPAITPIIELSAFSGTLVIKADRPPVSITTKSETLLNYSGESLSILLPVEIGDVLKTNFKLLKLNELTLTGKGSIEPLLEDSAIEVTKLNVKGEVLSTTKAQMTVSDQLNAPVGSKLILEQFRPSPNLTINVDFDMMNSPYLVLDSTGDYPPVSPKYVLINASQSSSGEGRVPVICSNRVGFMKWPIYLTGNTTYMNIIFSKHYRENKDCIVIEGGSHIFHPPTPFPSSSPEPTYEPSQGKGYNPLYIALGIGGALILICGIVLASILIFKKKRISQSVEKSLISFNSIDKSDI